MTHRTLTIIAFGLVAVGGLAIVQALLGFAAANASAQLDGSTDLAGPMIAAIVGAALLTIGLVIWPRSQHQQAQRDGGQRGEREPGR